MATDPTADDILRFTLGLSARTECPIDVERTMKEVRELVDRAVARAKADADGSRPDES